MHINNPALLRSEKRKTNDPRMQQKYPCFISQLSRALVLSVNLLPAQEWRNRTGNSTNLFCWISGGLVQQKQGIILLQNS